MNGRQSRLGLERFAKPIAPKGVRFDSCVFLQLKEKQMPTAKHLILPGTFVVVDNKGRGINSPVILFQEMKIGAKRLAPNIGDLLLITSPSFKRDRINLVRVFWQEAAWDSYYCSIRYSTTPQGSRNILPTKEEAKILLQYGKILREDVAKRFAEMNM